MATDRAQPHRSPSHSTPSDSTRDAYRRLSVPEEGGAFHVSRRHFLQGLATLGAGAAAGSLTPGWAREAFAAQPIGTDDGVLVVLLMGGGSDGLHTVVPYASGAYQDARTGVAFSADDVSQLDGRIGLHPNLTYLKSLYDAGQAAIVQGVGLTTGYDLSHFVSMATWMRGWWGPGGAPTGGAGQPTGWLGRWLDALGRTDGIDPLHAVHLGASVPLHLVGASRRASALGMRAPFGASRDAWERRNFDVIRSFAAASTGLGPLGDAVAATQRDLLDLAVTAAPSYSPNLPDGRLVRQLTLAARLVNADLGLRILSVAWGDFDSHNGLLAMHGERMAELDAGLAAFFGTLDARFASRVTLMTFSEFGRQLEVNASEGVDHGTANVQLIVGRQVRGGLYGAMPDLSRLDDRRQLTPTTDVGQVYATVVQRWLGADPVEILGRAYPQLDLFRAAPGAAVPVPPPGPTAVGDLVALPPLRRLDTRVGLGAPRRPVSAGQTIDLAVLGTGDVPPTGVTAVVLNVTAVAPTATGYLTVWPTGEARPTSSNLNFVAGSVVPNLVLCKAGREGKVSIFNPNGATHVVADVVGYVRAANGTGVALTPVRPVRLVDTRTVGRSPIGPDADLVLPVTGGTIPQNAQAVVLNVTATAPTATGYLTVYPDGTERPLSSNLNVVPGTTVPNLVVAKVGTNGNVRIYNRNGATHVIVDLLAHIAPAGSGTTGRVVALTPSRVLDTRLPGSGGALGAADERIVTLAGIGGVPGNGAAGVVVNVTVTDPTAVGHLIVWAADQARPTASNLNFGPGQTVPNLVISRLSPAGKLKLFNSNGRVHVVIDVVGYVAA